MGFHVPSLDITSLRAIYHTIANRNFPKLDLSLSLEYFPTELIHLTINYIQSKATDPEDLDLGRFTKRKIKRISMRGER